MVIAPTITIVNIGTFFILTKALGILDVKGLNLDPNPPDIITTGMFKF